MRDLSRAGPEIERRLRERLQISGPIIILSEQFGEMHAVPATTGWTVSCGTGFGVSIGAAGQTDGLHLPISDAFFEEEDCKRLLPLAAAKVADIFAGK
jgi:hypothetical protein